MPKAKGKGKGKGKARKAIDWAAEQNFDKNRSIIYIEHTTECPVFQLKADEFLKYVQYEEPERLFVLVRNKTTPRPGSFEIRFSQNARTSIYNLWSGLDKGPPRRDKFPDFYRLMPEVRNILKKFYADQDLMPDDDDDDDYVYD